MDTDNQDIIFVKSVIGASGIGSIEKIIYNEKPNLNFSIKVKLYEPNIMLIPTGYYTVETENHTANLKIKFENMVISHLKDYNFSEYVLYMKEFGGPFICSFFEETAKVKAYSNSKFNSTTENKNLNLDIIIEGNFYFIYTKKERR